MNVALERANIISNGLEQTGTYSSTMYATLNPATYFVRI